MSPCVSSAPGPVGRRRPGVLAAAGQGAHPAVPPLPVPASARELQAALRVRQPAGGPQLRPQHGDLRRAQEQLGEEDAVKVKEFCSGLKNPASKKE